MGLVMRWIIIIFCVVILFFVRRCHSDMVYYHGWGDRENICGEFIKFRYERGGRTVYIFNSDGEHKIWYGQPYTGVELVKNLKQGDSLCITYVDEYKFLFDPVVVAINKF